MASSLNNPQRRRRGMLIALAILLMTASGVLTAFDSDTVSAASLRAVEIVRLIVFLLLALVLAVRATSGFSLLGRNAVMDDELTRANRASAARAGFWALMIGAVLALIAGLFTSLTLAEAAPLLVAMGAGGAALRFAVLEGRHGG